MFLRYCSGNIRYLNSDLTLLSRILNLHPVLNLSYVVQKGASPLERKGITMIGNVSTEVSTL